MFDVSTKRYYQQSCLFEALSVSSLQSLIDPADEVQTVEAVHIGIQLEGNAVAIGWVVADDAIDHSSCSIRRRMGGRSVAVTKRRVDASQLEVGQIEVDRVIVQTGEYQMKGVADANSNRGMGLYLM